MNFLPDFSHIYVESQSIDSDIAEQSFKRFPKAKIIEIEDYKKIFNKNGQDFQIQKLSTKLILAKKQPPFIYPATDIIQDSGFSNFYYCTPILNCIYNCEYCFLQGMYSSANIVVFTNTVEVKDAVKKQILERKYPDEPLLLSLSYNTDILALENILPLTKQWIDFANNTDDLFMEIRTKSGLTSSFNKLKPSKKILFAWTLSPNNIIQKYEHKTPLLERRIMSIQKIVDSGWPVRLSFDPILIYPNWKEDYKQMFERIKETISGDKIFDITIGVFRMSDDFFNRIKKTKPDSDLFYNNYDNSNNVKTVTKDQKEMVRDFALSQLDGYCNGDKINFWD
ncbi:deoxyribodipyrimidine photo-lyase [bacterium]|nr:MAG: deoxyribodipyrimidine photo-lyase [bacterium]